MMRTAAGIVLLSAAFAVAKHVTVDAVADRTAVPPGGSATVALIFTIEPAWHLYWLNPGQAGAPPKVKWDVPAGVRVSEPQFPTPKRIVQGDVTSFGYERSLVLLQTVTLPPDARGPVELKAAVQWVVCGEDACVCETQPLTLTIPPGKGQTSAADRFAAWRAAQPARPDPPRTVAVTADGPRGSIEVPLATGVVGVDLFPPKANFLVYDKPVAADGVLCVPFTALPGGPDAFEGRGILIMREPAAEKIVSEEIVVSYHSRTRSAKE